MTGPTTSQTLTVSRGPYELYAELTPGSGPPVVLMHGFPDSTHLYDRVVPYLAGRRPIVRFDFLGWGRSDKPAGYPYTATNQAGDLAAVVGALDDRLGAGQLVLVAHDASGPPAIDWALAHPGRVQTLVLLNTYYHWIPALRRPPAIALYSTPVIRAAARAAVRRRPDLDRRLYTWQVGRFIQDPQLRQRPGPPGVLAPQRRSARRGAGPPPAHRRHAPLRPAGQGDLRRPRPLPQPSRRPELCRPVPP